MVELIKLKKKESLDILRKCHVIKLIYKARDGKFERCPEHFGRKKASSYIFILINVT